MSFAAIELQNAIMSVSKQAEPDIDVWDANQKVSVFTLADFAYYIVNK